MWDPVTDKPRPGTLHLALVNAVHNGDSEALAKLLKAKKPGCTPADRNSAGETPLMLAAAADHAACIDALVDAGADVRERDIHGRTALHVACRQGRLAAADALLRCGANPDTRDLSQFTCLHIAAREGLDKVCDLLCRHNAVVDAPVAEQGWTPLMLAANGGHATTCAVLLQHGADDTKTVKSDTSATRFTVHQLIGLGRMTGGGMDPELDEEVKEVFRSRGEGVHAGLRPGEEKPRVGGWQLARSKDKLDCCFEPDFLFQSSLQQELLHSSRRARHLEEPSVIVELSHELTHARRRAPTHARVVLLHRLLVERTVVHSRGCADADAVRHCVKLQHDYGWRTARRRPRRGGKNE